MAIKSISIQIRNINFGLKKSGVGACSVNKVLLNRESVRLLSIRTWNVFAFFLAQNTLKKSNTKFSIGTKTNSLTPKPFLFESDLFWSIPRAVCRQIFLVWYDQFTFNNKCLYIAQLLCCKRYSRKLIQSKTACEGVGNGNIEKLPTLLFGLSRKKIWLIFRFQSNNFDVIGPKFGVEWVQNFFSQIACTVWENK